MTKPPATRPTSEARPKTTSSLSRLAVAQATVGHHGHEVHLETDHDGADQAQAERDAPELPGADRLAQRQARELEAHVAALDLRLLDQTAADVPLGAAPDEQGDHRDGDDDGDQGQVGVRLPPADAVDERAGQQGPQGRAQADDARHDADGQRPVVVEPAHDHPDGGERGAGSEEPHEEARDEVDGLDRRDQGDRGHRGREEHVPRHEDVACGEPVHEPADDHQTDDHPDGSDRVRAGHGRAAEPGLLDDRQDEQAGGGQVHLGADGVGRAGADDHPPGASASGGWLGDRTHEAAPGLGSWGSR